MENEWEKSPHWQKYNKRHYGVLRGEFIKLDPELYENMLGDGVGDGSIDGVPIDWAGTKPVYEKPKSRKGKNKKNLETITEPSYFFETITDPNYLDRDQTLNLLKNAYPQYISSETPEFDIELLEKKRPQIFEMAKHHDLLKMINGSQ